MAQPNPPPTLILSDHEPVLLSGVGEGWERLPLRGETQDVSQKMRMGSPLNRSSDRSSHAAQTTRLRVGGPDVRGSRCEVEASPAPHLDSSRESLRPGPQGDRHPGHRALTQPPGLRNLGWAPASLAGVAAGTTLPTMPDAWPKACSQ